jgi:hypothetical protein
LGEAAKGSCSDTLSFQLFVVMSYKTLSGHFKDALKSLLFKLVDAGELVLALMTVAHACLWEREELLRDIGVPLYIKVKEKAVDLDASLTTGLLQGTGKSFVHSGPAYTHAVANRTKGLATLKSIQLGVGTKRKREE